MKTREYEGMFLLDNTAATENFEAAAGQVDAILQKHGAEIVHKEKWDERRLAYEIRGHRRATYYLVYFRAPSPALKEVRQDALLNETILRHLTILLQEPIATHIEKRAKERELLAEDSRKASLTGWGEKKRRDRDGGRRGRDDDDYDTDDEDRIPQESAADGGYDEV
jgi:small subunit ribosomal protein S6